MHRTTTAFATVALGAAVLAGSAGAASAQTGEHILLARQVGVPTISAGGDGSDCWDWTNEDGTTGTSCGSTARVVLRWEKIAVP